MATNTNSIEMNTSTLSAGTNAIDSTQDPALNSSPRNGENIESVSEEPVRETPDTQAEDRGAPNTAAEETHRGVRFWCIILAVAVTGILSALEGTVVGTALPTIVNDLGGAELYIWTINGYFLTSMVFTPLYGQMANIIGRRYLMIFAITVFIAGSAISGAAQNISMLIAGRAIQGVGGGGINMLGNLIVSDIVPLRERGKFMAVIFAAVIVGTGIGPFVGGAIVESISWRWVFFINLPVGGLALGLVVAFLQVGYNKESSVMGRIKRIDFVGNALFIPSMVAILIALTWGGSTYSWGAWQVLFPLVLGFIGLGAFSIYESSRFCAEPMMPPRLFLNRTSAVAFILSFIQSALLYWIIYYLPVYFQGVHASSPSRSGVQILPTVLVMIPFAAFGGKLLEKFGRYKPFHHGGFALVMIGLGCLTLLTSDSSAGMWAPFQAIIAAGLGFISSTILPTVLAPLEESDVATATGTWAFLRSFGIIWGVTIPGAVFNNQFDHLSNRISSPDTRALLVGGHAYEHATKAFVTSLPDSLRLEVIGVYSDSLKLVWEVAIAVAGLGFLLVFVEKEVKLRTALNTEFGIKKQDKEAKARSTPETAL